MNINKEDFKKQYFKNINNIEYQPKFVYDSFENGEYKNLVITKTAEEVYQEWLENKDKKQDNAITTEDRVDEIEASLAELSIILAQKGVI